LDRRVVGDDHHFLSHDAADAADHPGGRRGAVVHVLGGERRDLQERRTRIEQGGDAVTRQQLAPAFVACAGLVAAAGRGALEPLAQLRNQFPVVPGVGLELGGTRVEGGAQYGHALGLADGKGHKDTRPACPAAEGGGAPERKRKEEGPAWRALRVSRSAGRQSWPSCTASRSASVCSCRISSDTLSAPSAMFSAALALPSS